jgi:hypothetical protein
VSDMRDLYSDVSETMQMLEEKDAYQLAWEKVNNMTWEEGLALEAKRKPEDYCDGDDWFGGKCHWPAGVSIDGKNFCSLCFIAYSKGMTKTHWISEESRESFGK